MADRARPWFVLGTTRAPIWVVGRRVDEWCAGNGPHRRGRRAVAHCAIRVVLLHYSPVQATLEGEPEGIHTFLGSERLAPPIDRHRPDLVLHGHAHAGRLRGAIGDVPVYNVSVPVMQRE